MTTRKQRDEGEESGEGAGRRDRRSFLKHLWDAVSASPDAATRGEREELARQIEKAYHDEPPPTIVLFGEAGVGKSTTINNLFGAGQKVGHTRPTTATPQGWDVGSRLVKGANGLLRVVDMPGVGDDVSTYTSYRKMYLQAMAEADVVLWIHPAADRAVAYVQRVVEDLYGALDVKHPPGLVFGLNKADEMYPNDWHPITNTPSEQQRDHLREREEAFAQSMRPYVPRRTSAPISYSALKRYRLASLFRTMMEAVRKDRRWVLESRMALADLEQLIDRGALDIAKRLAAASPPEPPREKTPRRPGMDPAAPSSNGDSVKLSPAARRLRALPRDQYEYLTADPERLARWIAENGDA